MIGWGDIVQSGGINIKPQVLQQLSIHSIHYNHSTCANVTFDNELQFCAGFYEGGKGEL